MTTEQSAVLLLAEIKRRTVELQQEQATAVELLAKIHRAVGALERQLLIGMFSALCLLVAAGWCG